MNERQLIERLAGLTEQLSAYAEQLAEKVQAQEAVVTALANALASFPEFQSEVHALLQKTASMAPPVAYDVQKFTALAIQAIREGNR